MISDAHYNVQRSEVGGVGLSRRVWDGELSAPDLALCPLQFVVIEHILMFRGDPIRWVDADLEGFDHRGGLRTAQAEERHGQACEQPANFYTVKAVQSSH